MPIFSNKIALLAKVQPAGVDAIPTGAVNAMLVSNPKVSIEMDGVERNVIRPYFGGNQNIPLNARIKLEFEVELASSGAAGTAPPWGVLLRGCSMAETITASTKVDYSPITDNPEKLSIYYNLGGVNHKLLSARGTFSIDWSNKQLPKLKFAFTGLHGGLADTALPSVTLTAFKQPLPFSADYVVSFSLLSYAALVESLSLDIANDVKYRSLPPAFESIEITGRKPSGQVQIEAPTIATKDFFSLAEAGTVGTLAMVHGTTAGSIIELSANIAVGKPDWGDSDGVAMLGMPLYVLPTAGNDEFKLTVR